MRKYLFLFLFASILLACNNSTEKVTVTVSNQSDIDREHEMVEIPWDAVSSKLNTTDAEIIVVEGSSTKQIPYQKLQEGTGSVTKLLFPVSVKGGESVTFEIKNGVPENFNPMVYGRLVPERKDDFTWENNRSAFRIYGPALEATGEISNGMDYWAKRTESLVIDKWYEKDLAGIASYHQDNGEGLDYYKVGRTLGLGMTAPYNNDTLCLGKNFIAHEVLDNGPLRVTAQFTYKPYEVGEIEVTEKRTISLDAYSYMNKIQKEFNSDNNSDKIYLATGLAMEDDSDVIFTMPENGIIAYKHPEHSDNGTMFAGVINSKGFADAKVAEGHLLGINEYEFGSKYTYYTGGGWTKSFFKTFEQWTAFLQLEEAKLQQPLQLEIN